MKRGSALTFAHNLSIGLLLTLLLAGPLGFAQASADSTFLAYIPHVLSQRPPSGEIIPDDYYFSANQWPLIQIAAPAAWSITTGEEIVVAVIDTGVDHTHPDLTEHFVDAALWKDFVNEDDDPMDGHGHGTHVAGIIAAASNNGQGIAGTSWATRILPLKVLRDEDGAGPTSNIAEAVQYATDQGARIINLSLGSRGESAALQSAIRYARQRGVVVIAAAGNYHNHPNSSSPQNDPPSYPGAMEGVLAVAATTRDETHASYSNVGSYVDVAAPGGETQGAYADRTIQVWSTLPFALTQPKPPYGWKAGTSMAAPHVSGLAALLLSERPSLGPDDVEYILTSTADDLGESGWDAVFGAGRINARRALEAAWYLNHPPHTQVQAQHPASSSAEVDCTLPHAAHHLLLRATESSEQAVQAGLSVNHAHLLQELPEWQLWRVNGDACTLAQQLNSAGTPVAELDLLAFTTDR